MSLCHKNCILSAELGKLSYENYILSAELG